MSSEELERLKSEYQTIKGYCDTLKYYKEKCDRAKEAQKGSRGFTSVELKEKYLQKEKMYAKAYNDLLQECKSRYNITSPISMKCEMRELQNSIRNLEAREQESPKVHEEANSQHASPPQVSKHLEEQVKQITPVHHEITVSRYQERYKIAEQHANEIEHNNELDHSNEPKHDDGHNPTT